ncbi:CRISPR-associated endonuclease Cas1 [Maioricimonas sp. JC845]|uniref:CRISPR-associated endonuclease Cas4g/Cas1g n=1 Tax=Maioricimonas sp. JC845 TaxID=3232138 RepID=UPI003457760F
MIDNVHPPHSNSHESKHFCPDAAHSPPAQATTPPPPPLPAAGLSPNQLPSPDELPPADEPTGADGPSGAERPAPAGRPLGAGSPTGAEPDDLIPARMLNEFTYCPRLGYLEWVQGEWDDNLETRQGTFGHRNVDKADRQSIPAPDDAPDAAGQDGDVIHARSIMLAAEEEGLLAKLDLLEIDGDRATPVDYKRGKVPDVPEGAYEPERVQLCAQGLVLRENGYECDEGVLYFVGSRRRVVIPFDDELIARTRQLVQQFRETARRGVIPPPLDDSPKCPRCSLVGICLPDETNLLREAATATTPPSKDGLRRLLPARNDALPMYVQDQGVMIGKSGDRLTVKQKGKQLSSSRLIDVSQVSVFGNVMFSAPALRELTIRGIPVCHFTYGGWFHGMTSGLTHKNVELRIRQYALAGDAAGSLAIARRLIMGKIRNARTLLRRHLGDRDAPVLRQLNEYHRRAQQAPTAETLLGLEGMAAKEYFAAFFTLLAGRHEFDVNGRNRRPPRDPVNAVLSFVYSLLVKELTVTLQAVGFDPMLGFFHTPRYGRPSLALDLSEEFRPLVADSVVLTVFNNGEVTGEAFLERAGAVTLTQAGRRSVIAAFERRLETEITHPIFGYRICYRRILEVQARLLARCVLGELHEYPSFTTR